MNITIVCIGKLKEKYWSDAIAEYSKRLKSYCSLSVIELREEKLPDNPSKAQEMEVIRAEGDFILKQIKGSAFVISLAIQGKQLSSEALADKVNHLGLEGKSDLVFIIGGSMGLSEAVMERADFSLSFSQMTFPHQMMRVILLEQIYRAFKINRNEAYHK